MNELRNMFTKKDFIVNSNIIKCISNLDMSLNEFLLVLYFINVSCVLNTDDIQEKLGFDEEKAVSTFGSLLDKKFIEMEVENTNNKIVEKINLTPLYDRLALNVREKEKTTDIYALFERELGRTLSSFEYEMINKWLEMGIKEDLIKDALKEAILNNVRNFKYIDKIIYEWNKNGIKKHSKETKSEEMFDYDWLEEDE